MKSFNILILIAGSVRGCGLRYMVMCFLLTLLLTISAPKVAVAVNDSNFMFDKKSTDQIVERFVKLSKAGGIIEQPKLPEEFYHNAKMYEINGDFVHARESYEHCTKYNFDFFDPWKSYMNVLMVMESSEEVVRVINTLKTKHPSPIIDTILALLQRDKNKRVAMLEAVVKTYPDFGPAFYEIASEYSETKIGKQGLSDQQKEKKYLSHFLELSRSGNVYRYYLDKIMAVTLIRDAEQRYEVLAKMTKAAVGGKQIEHFFNKNSCINTVFVKPPEDVKSLLYSYDNVEYFPIGHFPGNGVLDLNIELMIKNDPYTLYVKYIDIQNNLVGPFLINVAEPNYQKDDHFCEAISSSVIRASRPISAFFSYAELGWAQANQDFLAGIKSDGRFREIPAGSLIKPILRSQGSIKFEYNGNQFWTKEAL